MYDHVDIVHCVVTRSSGRTNIEHVSGLRVPTQPSRPPWAVIRSSSDSQQENRQTDGAVPAVDMSLAGVMKTSHGEFD